MATSEISLKPYNPSAHIQHRIGGHKSGQEPALCAILVDRDHLRSFQEDPVP